METTERYIPVLGYHWLTPLYDPLMKLFLHEQDLHGRLVLQADILPGMRVLDLGCGTGSLTILIKQSHLMAQVYGIDADPQVLEIARSKADQAGANITLERGLAYQLPYPDAWFERVLSSLVFHHLTAEQKQQAFSEVNRVLRPGGRLYLMDFGKPHGAYARLVGQVLRHTERAEDNIRGRLPEMMRHAGLGNVAELDSIETFFGNITIYRAETQME